MYKERTNIDRALDALRAVEKYTDYGVDDPSSLDGYVGDLLANILHLCDKRGICFETAMRRARMHYDAEVKEEEENQLRLF